MKHLLLTMLSFSFIGCGSLPTANVPAGGTIAIVYETPDYICHDHTGLTVFNNFIKYYELPSDKIENAIYQGYKSGFEHAGYKVVRKTTRELFGDLLPNSITNLSSQKSGNLISLAKKEEISLVLYTNSIAEMNLSSSKQPVKILNYCEGGTVLFTGKAQFRAEVLAYSMDTTAFDVKSGQNLGRLHFNEHPSFNAHEPKNLKELTQQDLERFLRDLTVNASFKASLIAQNLTSGS